MQFQRLFAIGKRIARLLAERGQMAFLGRLHYPAGVERSEDVAEQHCGIHCVYG